MKIAVLVSGGVDSSVALSLLQAQGHEVVAFYLKIWLEDELSFLGDCPWEQDLAYVRKVCNQLDVPLKIVSLQKEYWEHVGAYTVAEVKSGRTPNPDVFCNKLIKFGLFLQHIDDSYDKIASGHYAHIVEKNGVVQLYQAPDAIKDQTYFLSYLTQKQLKRLLFPIGHMDKQEVRAKAQELNLPNKDRKDSQGICFLGALKFDEFIKHHLGEKPGNFVEFETGNVLGKHKGFWFHTIGQRRGIGLSGGPWYVVQKDPQKNIVYISRNYYSNDKVRNTFEITDCNWIIGIPSSKKLQVKLRHGAQKYECELTSLDTKNFKVTLQGQDQGIAPGQFAVLYDGQVCLGAGVIVA